MAELLSLVRRSDMGTTDISSVNLINSSGIELAEDGWRPQMIPFGENEVAEAMTFVVNGTSDNALATTIQAVYQKAKECDWSQQAPERYQVYLRDQLSSETNTRQAVVKSMEFMPGASLHDYYPVRNSHAWKGAQLGLVRGHWEGTAYTYSMAGADWTGGTIPISAPGGDIPGRLACLQFSSTANDTELWWGFKSGRHITLSNFVYPWDVDASGSPTTGSDTTIAGGYFVTTFATDATMAMRFGFTPNNISASNSADLRGSYRILARANVDAGTARIKMAWGMGTSSATFNNPVLVSGTSSYLYDLGEIELPAGGNNMPNSAIPYSDYYVYAERVGTASVNLSIDTRFLPIPIDEGCGHAKSPGASGGVIICDPLGRISSYDGSGQSILDTSGTNAENCIAPTDASVIVVAGQTASSHGASDTILVGVTVYSRWLSLRGSA